jgi:hypothetical protein
MAQKEDQMNPSKHLKIAGTLQFVPGIMWLGFGSLANINQWINGKDLLTSLIAPIIVLGGGLQIWFGISLIMQKQWISQSAGFILCAIFSLVGIPVGTVVNLYTLWVLMQINKKKAK